MNTIEFLFSLENKHTFFPNGMDDLQVLLSEYDKLNPSVIEKEFTSVVNLKKQEFLIKLQKDLDSLSLEEVEKVSNLVSSENNMNGNSLTNVIRKFIYHYAVKNEKFDLAKNLEVVALGVLVEIREDLYSNVNLSFHSSNENVCASYNSEIYRRKEDTHLFSYNINKKYETRNELLFSMLSALYHESYHALVSELSINPNSFKLDILEYQKYRVFTETVLEGKEFYVKNYDCSHEEAEADIYGTHKAYQKLTELNKNFSFDSVYKIIAANKIYFNQAQFTTTFKTGIFKRSDQKEYIDNKLDNILMKYPSYVYGMLNKIYNQNGVRKNLSELISDYENYLKENENNKDIPVFYSEIVLDYLKKYPLEIENCDEYTVGYIENFYKIRLEYLKEKIAKLSEKNTYSISSKIKKEFMKQKISKEFKSVEKLLAELVEKENLKL